MKRMVVVFALLIVLAAAAYRIQNTYHVTAYVKAVINKDDSDRREKAELIRKAMTRREENLTIYLLGNPKNMEAFASDAVLEAFEMDDPSTSDDYDFLRFHFSGMNAQIQGCGAAFRISYRFSYMDSKAQLDQVNEKVTELMDKIEISEMDCDYDKIKTIHDLIIDNTEYDLTVSKNTAYTALLLNESACQGYALLTYKLMTEAGIPCRIISGTVLSEPHAWNIVKLDGVWYNIDCTWDDPVGASGKNTIKYQYFLKNEEDFQDHIRDQEFCTDEFIRSHVMSDSGREIVDKPH